MADNPNLRGGQDRSRIALNQEHEVRYWTQTLGVSEEQLRNAIAAAGDRAEDVRKYVRGQD